MASFTDQISQFNPYIQQLPVDAMVKVGMYKQQQYDQGVQKIQAYVDNVAGMDVANDADKAYLQSKLNDLGSRLKTVAAGDFSNNQLVNSVGGMASSIVKDPTVQNAVSSTAWYRKQAAEMEKAVQSGKSSAANIDDFNQQASAWLSSNKAGQVFKGRYTPYTDVNKKFLEVLKAVHPMADQSDVAYEIDPATGKPNFNKIAAAMVRKGYEGVSAAKIQNAINASLTPDDINQLRLDANYRFKGLGTPELQNYIKTTATASVGKIDSMIGQLQEVVNLKSSSSVEKSQALQSIDDLNAKKAEINGSLDSKLEEAATNPNAVKLSIYKNSYIDQFANAFSWEKKTTELLTNPVLAADHWQKDYKLSQDRINLDRDKFKWDKYIDVEKLGVEKQKLELETEKIHGVNSGFTTYAGESTIVKNPLVAMKQDANAKDQSAQDGVKAMAQDLLGSASPDKIGAIEKNIELYRNATSDKDRNAIPVEWRNKVDQIIADRVGAKNLRNAIAESEKKVLSNPNIAGTAAALNQAIANKKGIVISSNGQNINFTNKEVFDFLNKEKGNAFSVSVSPTTNAPTSTGTGLDIDTNDLSPKERALYNFVKSARYGNRTGLASPQQASVTNLFRQYDDVIQQGQANRRTINDLVSRDLSGKSGKYIPVISTINVGAGKEFSMARGNMEAIASAVLSRYSRDKGGAEGLDVTAANEILSGDNKNDIQYQKLIQGDKTYLVLKKGTVEHAIPLTAIEAAQLPKNKNEATSTDLDVKTLQRLNGGKTNKSGQAVDGYFQRVNFGNVKNLNVTADLSSDKSNPEIQYMSVNIKLPSGWKTLQLSQFPLDANSAAKQVHGFTDNDIKQLFLSSNSIPKSWKDEILNLN